MSPDGRGRSQLFNHLLPPSRSTELLEEAVREILASVPFQRLVPEGMAAAVWAASYVERQQEWQGNLSGTQECRCPPWRWPNSQCAPSRTWDPARWAG